MTVLFMREGTAINLPKVIGIQPIGNCGRCKVFLEGSTDYLSVHGRSVVTTAWKRWLEAEDKSLVPATVTQVQLEEEEERLSRLRQQQIQDALSKGKRA